METRERGVKSATGQPRFDSVRLKRQKIRSPFGGFPSISTTYYQRSSPIHYQLSALRRKEVCPTRLDTLCRLLIGSQVSKRGNSSSKVPKMVTSGLEPLTVAFTRTENVLRNSVLVLCATDCAKRPLDEMQVPCHVNISNPVG